MTRIPRHRSRAPWIGLVAAVVIIAAALIVPAVTGWVVNAGDFAPLHSLWAPRFGPGSVPAAILAVLAVIYAGNIAARLPWRWLLAASFAVGLAWLVSLALVDGVSGLGEILDKKSEYLGTARSVTDFGATLDIYISHIPLDSEQNWPVHIAGHPPGALLFFVVLVHLGLGSWLASGLMVTLLAATTPVAVLMTLRRLGAEQQARIAAPFLVLGSAAVWMAVSADGMFGAVAAWGLCLLSYAATSRSWLAVGSWGLGAGVLLGYCVMLSYGLPLLGIIAIAVLIIARSARPLLFAVPAAIAVVLAFAAAGFAWWEAYPVLVERYWAGIASRRPFSYWAWGNLGALAISAGPIVGASIAVAIARLRGWRSAVRGQQVVVVLTLAAVAMVIVADLSAMSKAEVERIWLPFVPWLLVGTALLPAHWRRWGLGLQLFVALLVQTLLVTRW